MKKIMDQLRIIIAFTSMIFGASAFPIELHAKMTADQQQLAESEIRLAQSAFKKKKWDAVMMHYERAYRHAPSDELLETLVTTFDKVKGKRNCQERLRLWRRFRIQSKEPAYQSRAKKGYYIAKSDCERSLKIKAPQGISVLINGEMYGLAPLSTTLMKGTHTLELLKNNQQVYKGKVKVHWNRTLRFVKAQKGRVKLEKRRQKKQNNQNKQKKNKQKITSVSPSVKPDIPQSSDQVGERSVQVKPHPKGVVVKASLQCEYLKDGVYHPFPDCDGAHLKENDRFRVIFTAEQDSFVYLFLNNGRGSRAMLFPDRNIDNQAQAGIEYVIPGDGYWYTLDNEGGTTEQVHMIVSKERVDILEKFRGLNLTPEVIKRLQRMSFRGVRRMERPAVMSQRLKQLDTVLRTQGNDHVASINFSIQHR